MRGAYCGLCVLLLVSSLEAQPATLMAFPEAPNAAIEQPPTTLLAMPSQPGEHSADTPGAGLQHVIDAKLLLGLPTGVRFQAALDRQDCRAWLVEAFAGYELFNPAFGFGGRLLFIPATGSHGDALKIGPGLNFYYFVGDHSSGEHWFTSGQDGYFVVPNIEVAWLHDFHDHFGWELGLDLGVGLAVWQGNGVDKSRVGVVPEVSVFTGLTF